jgi:hypothetical protein
MQSSKKGRKTSTSQQPLLSTLTAGPTRGRGTRRRTRQFYGFAEGGHQHFRGRLRQVGLQRGGAARRVYCKGQRRQVTSTLILAQVELLGLQDPLGVLQFSLALWQQFYFLLFVVGRVASSGEGAEILSV